MEQNKNTENNPWKKLSTRHIYDNPWIRIEEDKVVRPDGVEGIYGRVHMKNKAIGIVAIDACENIWLVGQYRYTLKEYSWEIPTGGGPADEDNLTSAKRELKEETGLTAGKWTEILRIHTSNSITDEEGFVYLAEDLTEGDTDFDATEVIQVRNVPLHKAVRMVMDNEITDSLSIAGILKLARILGR
jgi:8-oxo-dGTP pyrophosphatase MutT (NUDIX family)